MQNSASQTPLIATPADKAGETSVAVRGHQTAKITLAQRVLHYFAQGGAALRHRNYRLFFIGQLISLVGTWMQNLAQDWLVLKLTNSVFDLGVVSALQFLPVLALSLFGGVLADWLPKRPTLIVTQSASMVLAFSLAALTSLNVVQVWHVYVLALLLGLVRAFDTPTRQAFVPEMVGKSDVMNAVALNSSVFNAARAVGPAVSGILIAIVGIAPAFWINGTSYIAVIIGLFMMRDSELQNPSRRGHTGSVMHNLREGLSFAFHNPTIRSVVILVGLVGTFGINFSVWIPDLAKNYLNVGANGYGILMAGFGIGALTTALSFAVRSKRPRLVSILRGAVGFGLFEIGVALSPWFWVSFILMMGTGMCMMIVTISCNTLIQLSSPDVLQGRVMSVYMLVFVGTTPLGSLFVGWLASVYGTPFSIATGGIISILAVPVVWWLSRTPKPTTAL